MKSTVFTFHGNKKGMGLFQKWNSVTVLSRYLRIYGIRKSSQLERKGKNQIEISSKIKKLNRENEVIFWQNNSEKNSVCLGRLDFIYIWL